ncbi:conserved hypothetical protein [Rhodospirillaceae bacterium LM-1]|nr:conserved hypothetical protein [Rhodospirillaceae bacterium LM-1]
MSSVTFDKLAYLETLKASGIPEPQARAHAHALDDALRDSVATRDDVSRLEALIRETELRLTVKLGAMLAASVAIVAALVKLL